MNTNENAAAGRITGIAGEDEAVRYLTENGYVILHRNYRIGHDEIDIIASKEPYTVFVEVKTRTEVKRSLYGRPASAVNAKKRACLARAAEKYIRSHPSDSFYRFDVIEVWLCHDRLTGEGSYRINHMKGAFGAHGRIRF